MSEVPPNNPALPAPAEADTSAERQAFDVSQLTFEEVAGLGRALYREFHVPAGERVEAEPLDRHQDPILSMRTMYVRAVRTRIANEPIEGKELIQRLMVGTEEHGPDVSEQEVAAECVGALFEVDHDFTLEALIRLHEEDGANAENVRETSFEGVRELWPHLTDVQRSLVNSRMDGFS